VVAKAPAGAAPRPAVVVAPPLRLWWLKPPAKPPVAVPEPAPPAAATKAPAAPHAKTKTAKAAEPAEIESPLVAEVAAPAPEKESILPGEAADLAAAALVHPPAHKGKAHTHASPTPALPARRMVMPQTGPRPVYTAPPVVNLPPRLPPEPPLEAFSAAGRSLTAAGPVAALAAILSAPQAAIPERASSRRPATQAPHTHHWRIRRHRRPGRTRSRPPFARVPASELHAPAAHPGPVALRQPARPHARSAPHLVDAAVARSIQKPRKAR